MSHTSSATPPNKQPLSCASTEFTTIYSQQPPIDITKVECTEWCGAIHSAWLPSQSRPSSATWLCFGMAWCPSLTWFFSLKNTDHTRNQFKLHCQCDQMGPYFRDRVRIQTFFLLLWSLLGLYLWGSLFSVFWLNLRKERERERENNE